MIEQIKKLVKDKSDPELHISERRSAQRELQTCASEYTEYLVGKVEQMKQALIKSEEFISAIMGFYGKNLKVSNWHLNGDTEPWDNFFDENMYGDELEVIREALKAGAE